MALLLHPLAHGLFDALDDELLLPAALGCRARGARSASSYCAGRRARARVVVDGDAGGKTKTWTLSVPLPGVAPSDVTVESSCAEGEDEHCKKKILVHALPHHEGVYRLPEHADLDGATARLSDGELLVTVPVAAPEPISVPVVAGPAPHEQKQNDEGVNERLFVPGFNASMMTVTVDPATRTVTVEGRREAEDRVAFSQQLALPTAAQAGSLAAHVQDGVLTLTCPLRAADPPTAAVPVEAEGLAEPAEGEQLVVRLPMPGVPAHKISLAVAAGGHHLSVKAEDDGCCGMRSCAVRLPRGVPPAQLRAVCRDGLLTVLAPEPAAPAVRAIPISSASSSS